MTSGEGGRTAASHGRGAHDELVRLRLIGMLAEIEIALARVADEPEVPRPSTVAVLERLRADLLAALEVAGEPHAPG